MRSLALYERAFTEAFRAFYGDPAGWSLYGLLPSYLERKGSSLVYMVDRLIAACGSATTTPCCATWPRTPNPRSCSA